MGQTVLITGASQGIGEASASLFARKGYDLVLVARNAEKLAALKTQLIAAHGRRVEIIAIDLTETDAPLTLLEILREKGITIDILVNNAGMGDCAPYLASSWEKQQDMVTLNIMALMQMTYVFGKEMKQRGHGRILNVASIAGLCAGPYMSVYYATKAFVIAFSEALAMELKEDGVTVTCLCPGPTSTGFMEKAHMGESPAFKVFPLAKAEQVAKLGVEATLKGKELVIHGIGGHLLNVGVHLLPRKLMAYMTAWANGKRVMDDDA